jgi:hypothetical protein
MLRSTTTYNIPLPLSDDDKLSARTYMLHTLPHITDNDSNDLAEYALGLISRQNKSIDELKISTIQELSDFLEGHTESFVDNLFQHLHDIHSDDTDNQLDSKASNDSDDLYADIDVDTNTHNNLDNNDNGNDNADDIAADMSDEDDDIDEDADRDTRRQQASFHSQQDSHHVQHDDNTDADSTNHYQQRQGQGQHLHYSEL